MKKGHNNTLPQVAVTWLIKDPDSYQILIWINSVILQYCRL